MHTNRAWLLRDFASTCPHAEHRWLVNAALTFTTRPGAFCSSRRTSTPHPDRRIPRFSPAFCRTFRPGFSRVPFCGPGHVPDPQVLDLDHVEPPHDVRGRLLGPVLAPVRFPGPQPGDGESYLLTARRAPLGAGELAFQSAQPSLLSPGQTRDPQPVPGRQGRTDFHTAVDTHDLAVPGCRHRRRNRREGDMPAPGPIEGHPVGFYARGNGAGPAEPDPARLRHPDLAGVAAKPSYLVWFEGDDPESLVPAFLAPRRPPGRVARVEERGHCLREVPQRLLLHRLGAFPQPVMFRAGFGELSALFQVTRRSLPARPPVRVLLDRQVPHEPGVAAVISQYHLLSRRWKQTIPGHANTLTIGTDITEVTRRLPWR